MLHVEGERSWEMKSRKIIRISQ